MPILPKLGASKGYFTSLPLYGRPSARDIGLNLMNATTPVQPPPTPQCVHQSRLHASYDIVAANPLIKPAPLKKVIKPVPKQKTNFGDMLSIFGETSISDQSLKQYQRKAEILLPKLTINKLSNGQFG